MENIAKSHTKVDEISPLTLAFVGDGVYDLLVRDYLVNLANRPVGELIVLLPQGKDGVSIRVEFP